MLFAAIVIGALKANIVYCCDIFLYNNLYTAPDERLSSKIFFFISQKKVLITTALTKLLLMRNREIFFFFFFFENYIFSGAMF